MQGVFWCLQLVLLIELVIINETCFTYDADGIYNTSATSLYLHFIILFKTYLMAVQ